MNITDEILSAFLDQELPEAQMQAVRQALAEQPELAARLGELAMLDQRLGEHFGAINHLPLPASVQALLSEEPCSSADNRAKVVVLPLWRRAVAQMPRQAAAVAGLALVAGFVLSRLLSPVASTDGWADIQAVLEKQASGRAWQIGEERAVEPRLSFIDRRERFCRQYRLTDPAGPSDDVACRGSAGWELVARVPAAASSDGYAPATHDAAVDALLDRLINGELIGPEQEAQLLQRRWQAEQ